MKEQIIFTNFTCDQCGKKIELQTQFPYDSGWKYIYNFSIKNEEDKRVRVMDKHFCCKTCTLNYLWNLIRGKK